MAQPPDLQDPPAQDGAREPFTGARLASMRHLDTILRDGAEAGHDPDELHGKMRHINSILHPEAVRPAEPTPPEAIAREPHPPGDADAAHWVGEQAHPSAADARQHHINAPLPSDEPARAPDYSSAPDMARRPPIPRETAVMRQPDMLDPPEGSYEPDAALRAEIIRQSAPVARQAPVRQPEGGGGARLTRQQDDIRPASSARTPVAAVPAPGRSWLVPGAILAAAVLGLGAAAWGLLSAQAPGKPVAAAAARGADSLGCADGSGACFDSGWLPVSNSTSAVFTIRHGLGAVPRVLNMWFSPTADGARAFALTWNFPRPESGNPVTIEARNDAILIHTWGGAPIHGIYDGQTEKWTTYNEGFYRVVVLK